VAILNASLRWQIIWCADMRPQRRWLSGRTVFKRRRISALLRSFDKRFMLAT
jgi:hypothetical protein